MEPRLSPAAQERLRDLVGRYAFSVDGLAHRLHLPDPLMHNLCLAGDVTVGWGPGAEDWPRAQTRFLRWFYRWFWAGKCPECNGEGTISIWRKGDPSEDFHEEPCEACEGTGRMPERIRLAVGG